MPTLADIGEDALIERIAAIVGATPAGQGIGDDCAVCGDSLLKTDSIISGRHFLPETPADLVGQKAVNRVMSDFAAMGGVGRELLISIALPPETEVAWVERLYTGMSQAAQKAGAKIVGGETSGLEPGSAAVITVGGRGGLQGRSPVLRSGGKNGDHLCVTGTLGGSIAGHHLAFSPRTAEGCWLARQEGVRAMMDLSDGLGHDASRLARASGLGHRIRRDALPITPGCDADAALYDGEDYELLVAISPQKWPGISAAWQEEFPNLPLTHVGELVAEPDGATVEKSFRHF